MLNISKEQPHATLDFSSPPWPCHRRRLLSCGPTGEGSVLTWRVRLLLLSGPPVPPCLTSGLIGLPVTWVQSGSVHSPALHCMHFAASSSMSGLPFELLDLRLLLEHALRRVGAEQAELDLSALLAPPCLWPHHLDLLQVFARCRLASFEQRPAFCWGSFVTSPLHACLRSARISQSNRPTGCLSASEKRTTKAGILVSSQCRGRASSRHLVRSSRAPGVLHSPTDSDL